MAVPNLNFDGRAITFPTLSETHSHVGAAWTPRPTVDFVVHVVNDDTRSVDLLGGSAGGFLFSGGTLTPDDRTLAPGRSGALHGSIAPVCGSDAVDRSNRGFVVTIRAKTAGLGIPRTVRLELGDAEYNRSLVDRACGGIRLPVDVTTRVVTANGTTRGSSRRAQHHG